MPIRASDVPGQIRDVVSAEPRQRDAAFYALFGNIWHQGSVPEAMVYALPMLIELLRAHAIHERPLLALLIACSLNGRGWSERHSSLTRLSDLQPPDVEEKVPKERQIAAPQKCEAAAIDAPEAL